MKKFLFFIVIFFFISVCSVSAYTWKEEKGKHFIIQYPASAGSDWARRVLRESERYYNTIAGDIGYSRYDNFWTWNERVKITIYPNKEIFHRETGQPEWSRGGAGRHNSSYSSRHIVTYKQEDYFLDGILPHEISHLMLRDFIGFGKNIPLWLDEGVAQLQERTKRSIAHQIMRSIVHEGRYIPLHILVSRDIRGETDVEKVKIFYAQSISIIDFLIHKHGSNKFGKFCRELKNGKTLEQALRATYTSSIRSLADLETKWIRHMKNY